MEQILNKIRKLLALANNNDNEHQAAAASAKAMELMERHNLDLSVFSASKPDGSRDDRKLKGGLYGWQRKLWESCAKLNFCMYWSIKGTAAGSSYEHRMLGRAVNVASAQIMAEYLQNTIERLAKAEAKETGCNVFAREMIAYREGMARRLTERLAAKREEKLAEERQRREEAKSQPAASTGNALVLMDVIHSEEDYNTDYLYHLEPGTTAKRRAENEARYAALLAEREAKHAEHEQRYASDPAYAAEYDAIQAAEHQKNEQWWADYQKKEAKRASKRKDPQPRYRRATPEEERAGLSTYRDGYQAGNNVGLDDQIDRTKRTGIR